MRIVHGDKAFPKANAARKLFSAFSSHFHYLDFKIGSSKIYTFQAVPAACCYASCHIVRGQAVLCSLPGDILGTVLNCSVHLMEGMPESRCCLCLLATHSLSSGVILELLQCILGIAVTQPSGSS